MRFVCLGCTAPSGFESMAESECKHTVDECFAYDDELRQKGHYVDGHALQPANTARTIRLSPGKLMVTDGPFAETKEQIGGIMVLEARDIDHAVELISKHPGLKMGPWEIRPASDLAGMMRESEKRRNKGK